MMMRPTNHTDQICHTLDCGEPATFYCDPGGEFYCEPCMVAISHEPPERKLCERSSCQRPSVVTHFYNRGGQERLCVEHAALPVKEEVLPHQEAVQMGRWSDRHPVEAEAVHAEVRAADAAAGVPVRLAHEIPGTPGGDYSTWADGEPAVHVQVPVAYGSGWASGYSAGWKAGMAYAIARQAEGTL